MKPAEGAGQFKPECRPPHFQERQADRYLIVNKPRHSISSRNVREAIVSPRRRSLGATLRLRADRRPGRPHPPEQSHLASTADVECALLDDVRSG